MHFTTRRILLGPVLGFLLFNSSSAAIYAVSTCGNDSFSGIWTPATGWADAKQTLQAALAAAGPNDSIYIRQGLYYGNFVIPNQVQVYGGFDGTETTFSQRHTKRNTVILDGGGSGPTVTFPSGSGGVTLLDGVLIRGGMNDWGGGIVAAAGSLARVNDCIIKENTATSVFRAARGGGVYIIGQCELLRCTIYRNQAVGNGYDGAGGAVYIARGTGRINNSLICENSAVSNLSQQAYGGGIYADTAFSLSTFPVVSTTFFQNQAVNTLGGASAWVDGHLLDLQNCLFAFAPSGVRFHQGLSGSLQNPLFDNVSLPIINGTATSGFTGSAQLAWPAQGDVHLGGGSLAVNNGFTFYSFVASVDFEGESRGASVSQWDIGGDESPLSTNNHLSLSLHVNLSPPTFEEPHGLPLEIEYHTVGGFIPLLTSSGYLDTMSNFFEQLPQGTLAPGTYDLRVRSHSTLWRRVSSTSFGLVGAGQALAVLYLGDINGDNIIDLGDLTALAFAYGSCECDPNYLFEADLNRDGCVDIVDYALYSPNHGMQGQ